MTNTIGQPVSRLDGPAKVTGAALYTADRPVRGITFAVLVPATIPSGSIVAIDAAEAEPAPGVLKVLTHLNTPRLQRVSMPAGQTFLPLQTDRIEYEGQPIAVVVADTLQNATYAAAKVHAAYRAAPFRTDFRTALGEAIRVQLVLRARQPHRRCRGCACFGAGQTRAHLPHRRPPSQSDGAVGHRRAVDCGWQPDRG